MGDSFNLTGEFKVRAQGSPVCLQRRAPPAPPLFLLSLTLPSPPSLCLPRAMLAG
jgi:hypothetical protein